MAEKTLLDVVNASLEPETPEPAKEPATEPEETPEPEEIPEQPAPEGDKPEGEKPEGAQPEGDKPDEPKPEGDVPKEGTAPPKEGKEGEQKPAEKKPLDPVNDPIPPTVSERTRERITSLVSTVKTQAAELETAGELFKTINGTGVTPENFASTLEYLRLYNSEKPADRERAYEFMLNETRALAQQLGKTPPGQDPLEGHQDLVDAVAAQSITQQHAEELANARNQRQLQQRQEASANEQSAAWNVANTQAKESLNELGRTLKTTDPQFEQKAAKLLPEFKEYCKTAHPSKWLGEFQKRYRDVKVAVAPPPAPPAKPDQQPLRANKQPTGDGKKQPSTMFEAVNESLKR